MSFWDAGATRARTVWTSAGAFLSLPGSWRPAHAPTRPSSHHSLRQIQFRRCPRALALWTVLRLDLLLRRCLGIHEFSTNHDCLLRLALATVHEDHVLDSLTVRDGQPIVELHLWNEHVPAMSGRGPDLAWASHIRRDVDISLRELAAWVASHDDGPEAPVAVRACAAFARRSRRNKMVHVATNFGFEVVPSTTPGPIHRLLDFWCDVWITALVWAFNPRSLRPETLLRSRYEFWMPRATLLDRYGHTPAPE